jgi:6-phosphogluconolactonase
LERYCLVWFSAPYIRRETRSSCPDVAFLRPKKGADFEEMTAQRPEAPLTTHFLTRFLSNLGDEFAARLSHCKIVLRIFMKISAMAALCAAGIVLSGCPITGGSKYTVGGTVTGLSGSGLVLELNGSDGLSFSGSGDFVFGTRLANNAAYSVTVSTQPSNPAQSCTVRNGSGTIDKAGITNVIVSCTQTGRFAYVANRQSNSISGFGIDSATGALVALSGSPFASSGTTPTAITVDPNGQFLYAANAGSNNVSVYSINATTGALTALGFPIATGNGPGAVIVDPTDHYLYVANLTDGSVSAFAVQNGALTAVTGSPFAVGAQPASLTFDPNGNFLYVTNFGSNSVSVLLLDQSTGILSSISGSPFGAAASPLSLAIDPTETYAFVANNTAENIASYSLNDSTGSLAQISGSPLAAGSNVEAVAVDPAGRFVFAANAGAADQIASYAITPASGILTFQSSTAAGSLPIAVMIDPSGKFLYAANFNSNDVSAYTVSSAGVLTPVAGSPFAVGVQPHSIAID